MKRATGIDRFDREVEMLWRGRDFLPTGLTVSDAVEVWLGRVVGRSVVSILTVR